MNSENIKKLTNQAIENLVTALKEGRSETLTQYLAAIGRFHRYSLRNVMLIASQKPAATLVAGFHAWHKLGRFVKKGEKGILILAPIVRRKNESAEQNETDESSTAVGFRAAYVFDISQTDGQELPGIGRVNGDPREYRERLAKFVAEQGIALEYSENIAPARGTSAGGKITLLPGQSAVEEFATLAHELAHEMMHRTERRNSTSKRIRETEAEAVAFVVCHAIGLETGSAAQDYIQLYDGDANLLSASLEYIQQTANQILHTFGADVTSAPNLTAESAVGAPS
jgi:antirestriction protein ArdC